MEYYILDNATTRKQVGRFFQTNGLVDGYNENALNSMTKVKADEFPNFIPDLRFELHEKAKLTDIVSAGNIITRGFLINEKVKTIFEICKLPAHKYYDATLNVKGTIHKYYWLHLLYNDIDGIDYINSSFYATYAFNKMEGIPLKSTDDYWAKQEAYVNEEKILTIRAERIKLLSTFGKFDMITFLCPLLRMVGNIFISSDLKDKLEKEKITGIDIESQDILLPY